MQNNLLRKSGAFGMALVMVAMMFAPVTMNVSAMCSCAGSTETVANVDRIENATQIIAKEGTFNIGQGEIQYENGKPVIRLFSTTWCPDCAWIKDTFDNTIKEYVQTGQIVAYHWDLDSGDNTLTDELETEVPQSELAVFQTFNPRGSIPTFVFGNQYWRIGNGYERQDNLIAEEAEFRRISGSERGGLTMYSPADSNITAQEVTSSGSAPPCENGCGPNGWKVEYVALVVDPVLLGPTVALLSATFDDSCNRHDRCYCHGYVTYCKGRARCDDDFLTDMKGDCDDALTDMEGACDDTLTDMKGYCADTFCLADRCIPACCEPAAYSTCIATAESVHLGCIATATTFYGTCIAGSGAFYEAVHQFGEVSGAYIPPAEQTCYDYDNLGGEWECPAENPTTVYVDGDFTGCPQHGTEGKPVTTVARGREMVAPGGTVIIAAGSYPESIVISKSMTLQASGGTVVIG